VQRSFAALFILLHRDALAEDTFLNAIGRLMLFNARANEMALPRLKDDRDQKTDYFKAFTDDNESKSPLARMFRELMPALRAQYKAGKVHGGRDASKLKTLPPPPTRAVVPRAAIDIKAAEAAAAAAAAARRAARRSPTRRRRSTRWWRARCRTTAAPSASCGWASSTGTRSASAPTATSTR
jgi:hypothetical protein